MYVYNVFYIYLHNKTIVIVRVYIWLDNYTRNLARGVDM